MGKFSIKNDPYRSREAKKYAEPIPSREYILQYLEKAGKPLTREQLIKGFGLRSAGKKEALKRRLIAMSRDGQLLANRKGGYALVDKMSLVRGEVQGHRDGYGFLIPEDGGDDLFLPAHQMSRVFHGDRVLVRKLQRHKKSEAVIVEVLEQNTTELVGRYLVEDGVSFVVSLNKKITQDILIPKEHRTGAKSGQLVVVKIISYPNTRRQPTGKIVEILGKHMGPGMEIEVAVRSHGLPNKWSAAALKESAKFNQLTAKDYKNREDLRKLPFVTIDGEDAKDFDDAVYCEKKVKGGWRLYVAIADVSSYVNINSALDKEAALRGNSVYFPGRVTPMLPEILSNELCSLKPKVDRLVIVCEMAIDEVGKITRYKFYEAVICSVARLTYTEVAEKRPGLTLTPLFKLYKILHKQREKRGAIDFETIETKIIFAKNKKIKSIEAVERNDAHRLIEECMLAANVCAAKFLAKNKIPALYRIHEGPTQEKLTALRDFLAGFGLKLAGGDDPTPHDYMQLMNKIAKRPDKNVIQIMLLRSMRQAVYDTQNIGHFGLAYEVYGHFTSPIRRYPDLITHRAIKHIVRGGQADNFGYDNNEIHTIAEHCSMTERRADDAVYDAIEWLKCEYMLDKIGKKFPGVVSRVCGFGLFVKLENIYVEGLVHITSLPNDYYEFDVKNHCLHGKRGGRKFRLGDKLKVLVARVDLDDRQIDFEL